MFSRTRITIHLIVITALLLGCGAQWGVLRTVAWTGMIISYSKNSTFLVAIRQTFSGERPCNLCVTIDEAEKQSKDPETSFAHKLGELKAVLANTTEAPVPKSEVFHFSPLFQKAPSLAYQPPVPVPRYHLA